MTFRLGITHADPDPTLWRDGQVASVPVHAQALMGWGAGNPEPSFGQLEFDSLDYRIDIMRAAPGVETMAMTFCGAPDWMKGGAPGTTNWARLEVAPDPAMHQAYAWLCARAAERYPDVTHFLVWNEFKGMWGGNEWDVARYGDLYRRVYAAVKKVRPDARIGGPYAPLNSPATAGDYDHHGLGALDAWWHSGLPGCDFVVVDGWGPAAWFIDATARMVRRYCVPIWWGELHVIGSSAAWHAAVAGVAAAGADVALLWEPEGLGYLGLIGA